MFSRGSSISSSAATARLSRRASQKDSDGGPEEAVCTPPFQPFVRVLMRSLIRWEALGTAISQLSGAPPEGGDPIPVSAARSWAVAKISAASMGPARSRLIAGGYAGPSTIPQDNVLNLENEKIRV